MIVTVISREATMLVQEQMREHSEPEKAEALLRKEAENHPGLKAIVEHMEWVNSLMMSRYGMSYPNMVWMLPLLHYHLSVQKQLAMGARNSEVAA